MANERDFHADRNLVIRETGVRRYADLTDESHPDYDPRYIPVVEEIATEIRENKRPVAFSWVEEFGKKPVPEIPEGIDAGGPGGVGDPSDDKAPWLEACRQLWAELHGRPLLLAGKKAEEDWLELFRGRVPCGDCRAHWSTLVRQNPPVLTSPREYAIWTWDVHNRINVLLDKPLFPFERAIVLWTWPESWRS